jgi:drug/metabolite transporter (DMT)-like permease
MVLPIMDWLYIAATVLLTVYGQVVLKFRLNQIQPLPDHLYDKFSTLFSLVFDPLIFSGFFAAFLASLTWMAALTRFNLSDAYPFMSLSFVLVIVLSGLLFGEPISMQKVLGVMLITGGTYIASKGIA